MWKEAYALRTTAGERSSRGAAVASARTIFPDGSDRRNSLWTETVCAGAAKASSMAIVPPPRSAPDGQPFRQNRRQACVKDFLLRTFHIVRHSPVEQQPLVGVVQ